jgi:hypothetical protein
MRIAAVAAGAAIVLCLSGCAAVSHGTSQEIAVSTPPVTGALCTLTNPRGKWQILSPGSANVLRSKGDIEIVCRKRGWNDAIATNKSVPAKSANLGPLAGAVWMSDEVDAMMGANNDYTPKIEVPMTPAAPPSPTP